MAEVRLRIGNRDHRIACGDGSEARLLHVSRLLDARWAAASKAAGGLSDERTMLFIALMLADALDETHGAAAAPISAGPVSAEPASAPAAADAEALDRVALRLEHLAKALEDAHGNP